MKQGGKLPVKLFDDWHKAGKWADENIKRQKGCDSTLYRFDTFTGIKKWVYGLFYNFT